MDKTILVFNIAIGLITGFLASLLTLLGDRWLSQRRLKRKLRRIEGTYHVHDFEGKRIDNTVVSLKLISSNTMATEAMGKPHHWKGQITFNEATPEYGVGIYRWIVDPDHPPGVGTHQMQYNPLNDTIHVTGSSMTLRRILPKGFSYVLHRTNKEIIASVGSSADSHPLEYAGTEPDPSSQGKSASKENKLLIQPCQPALPQDQ